LGPPTNTERLNYETVLMQTTARIALIDNA
jgi:hypothetical protein